MHRINYTLYGYFHTPALEGVAFQHQGTEKGSVYFIVSLFFFFIHSLCTSSPYQAAQMLDIRGLLQC